jgi:uncharacterized protein YjbI with pentapeptide repeats
MSNEEHVSIFKQGVKVWNRWRADNPQIKTPDLSNTHGEIHADSMDLQSIDLSGADLRRLCLDWSDLSHANLAGANLGEINTCDLGGGNGPFTNFTAANLRGANFRDAVLFGSDFRGANLTNAIFDGNSLSHAKFHKTQMGSTVFGSVDLCGAAGLDAVEHRGPSSIGIPTLYRSRNTIPESFLRGCGLLNWELQLARFYESDIGIGDITNIAYDMINSWSVEPIKFYSCFISYSHADQEFARSLYDMLQRKGIRCWLDEKQLLPGDDLYDQIDRGVRLWDKVLLCCSKHSLMSWWVNNEITIAMEKEQHLWQESGQKVQSIIPLNVDGYLFSASWNSGYQAQLRRRYAADFTNWAVDTIKFKREVEKVIRALRTSTPDREEPPLLL